MKDTKKNVYESTEMIINHETGEITRTTHTSVKKSSKEPDYIKLYLDCLCTFKGLNKALSPVLISFCHFMTWADNTHKAQMIFMNSYVKEQVCEMTGLKVDRINKALKEIVNAEIFVKVEGKRGVYKVNPFIIGKGEWNDIKELRANFDFTNGTVEPQISYNEVACTILEEVI